MSQQNDINVNLRVTSQTQDVRKFINEMRQAQNALGDFKKVDIGSDLRRDLDSAREGLRQLKREADLDKLRNELLGVADANEEVARTAREAANAESGLSRGQSTSKRGSRGQLGGFGTAIRDLPAIPIPGTNFSSEVIGRSLQGLDQFGLSIAQLGAATAVAIPLAIGFAVAINRINKALEEGQRTVEAIVSARVDFTTFRESGGTSDDAQQIIKDLNDQRTGLNVALGDLRNQLNALKSDVRNNVGNPLISIPSVIVGRGLQKQIDELNGQLIDADEKIREFEEGIASNALAMNDATRAAEEQALANQSLARSLEETRIQAENFGVSALQSAQRQLAIEKGLPVDGAGVTAANAELDRLRQRERVINAEVQALQSANIETEAVTEAIEALRIEQAKLTAQTNIVTNSLASAKATDDRTEAVLAEVEALQEAKRAEEERENAIERLAGQLFDLRTKLDDQLIDLGTKFKDKLIDIGIDLGRDLAKLGRDVGRDLRDAVIDARRDIRDALGEGNFLGVADIRRNFQDRAQDIERNAQDERQELNIQAREQRQDAQRNRQREERDIQLSYERRYAYLTGALSREERRIEQWAYNVARSVSMMISAGGGANTSATMNNFVRGTS